MNVLLPSIFIFLSANLIGIDSFTKKTREFMSVPVVKLYQLISIDEGVLVLMDVFGDTRQDLKVPDNEIGRQIKDIFFKDESCTITVWKVNGVEAVVGVTSAMN